MGLWLGEGYVFQLRFAVGLGVVGLGVEVLVGIGDGVA